MTYQWGRKVTWTSQEVASESTEFQVGEYGRLQNFAFASDWGLNVTFKGPQQVTKELADKLKAEHNAELLYISMDGRLEIHGDYQRSYYEVHELIFKGSPIAPIVIIAAIALIALVVIILAPVIWKLAGVGVGDIIGYSIGPLLILGAIIVVVLVVVPKLKGTFKSRHNGRPSRAKRR